MNRYNNYHKHTMYSNIFTIDSYTKIEDYLDRIKELNHTNYFTTEHGYGGDIFACKSACIKENINCIYAAEGYIVPNPLEKDNSNYHIMIIPKTDKSRRKLNKILSHANTSGYYYKPRIFLEDLLKCDQNDFYITNACVGGILRDEIGYEKIFIPLFEHFKNNFLLEIQDHNHPKQIELNKKIIELSKRFNLKLIHACDSHYIYPEDSKNRDLLLEGKGIKYEEESGFILDYPDYDEIVKRYKIQGVLNDNQIREALENTLIFDGIENININKEIKMPNINPSLNPQERLDKLKKIISNNYKKIIVEDNITSEEKPLYKEAILEEVKVLEDTIEINTMDYFLLNMKLVDLAINKYGGVLTTTSRGSAGAYYVNRLLGMTQLDRVRAKIPLYYQRFMSSARLLENHSLPDFDFNLSDPNPFISASKELLGENGCRWMVAFGTMQEAEAFRNVCRSKGIPFEKFNEAAKDLEKYKDKKEWKNIYDESKKFIDVIVSASAHPCSNILLDTDLEEEIGVIKLGEFMCCPITSGEADDWKYLKNDYLTVSTVSITKATFDLIGIPRMSLIELEQAVDEKTWEIYSKGLTCTINQVDSDYATAFSKVFKPKNVSELAMFVGAIRPNFSEFRDKFINRQEYHNEYKKMDDLFAPTHNFIIFQENLMQFFEWLGVTPAESIGLIKKISKKKIKQEHFDALTENLKLNWIKINGSEDGFEDTWKKMQAMMGYGFNSPHALAVAYDSLYGAYLKSHYPLEYYSIVLNEYKGDEKRTNKLTDELSYFGISLSKPKFRYSKSEYFMNKETNTIYKGTSAIKFLNETASSYLYSLRDKKYDTFIDLLIEIENAKTSDNKSPINTRQMEILIQLQYFEEFGKNAKLLSIYRLFKALYGRKTISKDKLYDFGLTLNTVAKNAQKETDKQFSDIDIISILEEMSKNIPNETISIKEQCQFELDILGYINCTYPEFDKNKCLVIEVDSKYTPRVTLYCLQNGKTVLCKIRKYTFKEQKLKKGDVINCIQFAKTPKWKKTESGFEKTNEKEWELVAYDIE